MMIDFEMLRPVHGFHDDGATGIQTDRRAELVQFHQSIHRHG